ncbi:hypothetical protein KEM48_011262 [Puccinia striiformis f. sp. tritici PST-130]|nr:hypothetical protein KEM48_011262 [Puccinia striiformis f. sp. tritici PST-130]
MSTVSRALISTIAIVTGGFVVGQYLQPDTRTSSIPELPTSETDDTDDGSFSESDLARLPLSELNRHLQNLNALKRNVEAERSIILNKLVEVDRRIQLAKRKQEETTNPRLDLKILFFFSQKKEEVNPTCHQHYTLLDVCRITARGIS